MPGATATDVIMVILTSLLYLGLRVYETFATTGTIEIEAWVRRSLPDGWSNHDLISVLLDLPFVVANSSIVVLVLLAVCRRRMWKRALAIGLLSEAAWVLLWRVYLWGRSFEDIATSLSLSQAVAFVGAPTLLAMWMEHKRVSQ